MAVFAGQGDTARSMELLWRGAGPARTAPGPKPGLSVEAIVEAGVAVADEEGLAALSMRAVGQRLGRTGMALYTYVPGKNELLDLMYDRVLGELPGEYDLAAGWRAALTAWARDLREFYLRHPWVLQLSQARPVLGPNEYRMLETLVAVLRGTGLGPAGLRPIVATLFNVVAGAARTTAEARQAGRATGVSDEDWWNARTGLLQELEPAFPERFPGVVWLESGAQAPPPAEDGTPYLEHQAARAFQAGLALVLDGIEAAVRRGGG
ncbi:TetR/AcrR family transcriptional regulator [Bailinhaonella thermotolerans]|uniref:TetR/AcrR family transcriptional regulator n=2 Tax=Bailinhaonella thermotolerans TaxID=1070861 RepID=A0A3A4AF24_9ACTN|nr:TetR/AcrR family transcriptional regulator C-terminal domain-containing protein [Bailinhaonella thermotolerans]RJL27255.1 TetR/AcrR family transcriptional regulator [Bailinhaonella thermotolerans]